MPDRQRDVYACELSSSSAADPDLERKALGLLLARGVALGAIYHEVDWVPEKQQYMHTWLGAAR